MRKKKIECRVQVRAHVQMTWTWTWMEVMTITITTKEMHSARIAYPSKSFGRGVKHRR